MFRIVHLVCGYLSLAVMAVRWFIILAKHRALMADRDVVVVMSSPRAFGTLFAAIDDTRRLYAGQKLAFIYHREPVGHNPLLGTAFSDIAIIDVPRRRFDFSLFGRDVQMPPDDWHDPMCFLLTDLWVQRFGKADAIVQNAFQLWRKLPFPDTALASLPRVHAVPEETRPAPFKSRSKVVTAYAVGELHVLNELHMYGGWNTLRARTNVPKMRLPEAGQQKMLSALSAARDGKSAKLCGFHTRYGGSSDKTHRDGSPLEFYIPAIRALVDAGYQVMMQGDRTFHHRFRETFDGMVVDAESLGIDKNIFRLFCGSQSDIFVGDWPVAPQMAASNGIPTLVVNAWPIGWAVNGIQVYYRGVRGGDGQRWDWKRTLEQGALINCNTEPHRFPELLGDGGEALMEELAACDQIPADENEILSAVTAFLEDLKTDAPESDAQKKAAGLMPDWTPFAMASDSRLNRAWIERYVSSD